MPSLVSCFLLFCKSVGTLSERRVVSKPQILSRLRYVNIIQRPDETAEERAYRTKYEHLQAWNNQYWAENNELFNREKSNYIREHFGQMNEEQALSHDQLASFYKEFLERNRQRHVEYNRTWYMNHISLLSDSIQAKLSRLKENLRGKNSNKVIS